MKQYFFLFFILSIFFCCAPEQPLRNFKGFQGSFCSEHPAATFTSDGNIFYCVGGNCYSEGGMITLGKISRSGQLIYSKLYDIDSIIPYGVPVETTGGNILIGTSWVNGYAGLVRINSQGNILSVKRHGFYGEYFRPYDFLKYNDSTYFLIGKVFNSVWKMVIYKFDEEGNYIDNYYHSAAEYPFFQGESYIYNNHIYTQCFHHYADPYYSLIEVDANLNFIGATTSGFEEIYDPLKYLYQMEWNPYTNTTMAFCANSLDLSGYTLKTIDEFGASDSIVIFPTEPAFPSGTIRHDNVSGVKCIGANQFVSIVEYRYFDGSYGHPICNMIHITDMNGQIISSVQAPQNTSSVYQILFDDQTGEIFIFCYIDNPFLNGFGMIKLDMNGNIIPL